MDTFAQLEKVMRDTGTRGVTVSFGRSAAPGKRHQFFANIGGENRQAYGDTLAEAIGKLFGAEIDFSLKDDEDILI